VSDVVGALLKLMVLPEAVGEVINVGNTGEVTIRGLAEKVKAATGSASEIVTIPYDKAYEAGFEDMPRRVPDLEKIRRLIGYEPKVALDEIIARVVASMRPASTVRDA
ncbi:MAG: nucleoside-diphosphate sugar epimerase, partial [Vicinamibacteria bacterium]